MNNDKLIEAMARGIHSATQRDGAWWPDLDEDEQEMCRAEARAALAALQEHTGWIPVSERLPPEGVDVLVLHDYGQIVVNPAHRDHGKRYRYKITRRYGNGFLIEILETGQVTHWMPIPPAPQPEEAP